MFLHSEDFDQTIMAPPLTEDDAFNSHPLLGTLSYRLPALDTLFGFPMSYVSAYEDMYFYLSIKVNAATGLQNLACGSSNKCRIKYSRKYSPLLYYIRPPIVYYESTVELVFDPKSTPSLISGLEDDEMPFINAKIGSARLDFEFSVDDENIFS